MLGITPERQITVSVHYVGRSTAAHDQVFALTGHEIIQPQNAFPTVRDHHVAWHTREVFRSPARTA